MARKHGTEHQRNPDFNRLLTALHCGVPDRVPLAEIMIDETPALITYWISVNRAMRKEVEGVTADPGEFLDLSNAWLNV